MGRIKKNKIKRKIKISNWIRLISLLFGIFLFVYRMKVYDGVLPDDVAVIFITLFIGVIVGLFIPSMLITEWLRDISTYKATLIKKKKEFYASQFGTMILDKKPNIELIKYFDTFLSKYDDKLFAYIYGLMTGIIYSDEKSEFREEYTKYIKDNLL